MTKLYKRRVLKACERCRMKKSKCDGESPCKRCQDAGCICATRATRAKMGKQRPPGYSEVLEYSQLCLVAAVRQLYKMVRESNAWEYGEPQRTQDGEPVVHDIVKLLGCIKTPPSDLHLDRLALVIPECQASLEELSTTLEMLQGRPQSPVAESSYSPDGTRSLTSGSEGADSTACSVPLQNYRRIDCPDQIELASPVCYLDEFSMPSEYFADLVPQNSVEDCNFKSLE